MNDKHLTENQLDQYRQRRMNPAELLAADAHLAGCGKCRDAASREMEGAATVESLQDGLRSVESSMLHLPYGQLEAFVDGTLEDVEREIVESHLAVCGDCRADWLDLDLFRKSLAVLPKHQPMPNPWRWWRGKLPFRFAGINWTPVRAAVMVAGVVVLVWLGSIPFRSGTSPKSAQVVMQSPPHMSEMVQRGTGSKGAVSPILELKDGGGTIVLRSDGSITGLHPPSTELRDAVKAVLSGSPLTVSENITGLAEPKGVLLGASGWRPEFRLSSPLATAVISDRPTLRWQPLDGARRYEVSVYDASFTPVALSPPLQQIEWSLPRSLQRSMIYTWQVKALTGAGEVLSPRPPEPAAKFKVLDSKTAHELMRIQQEQEGSHLALAIQFAGAGALDDAEREIRALAQANPQSSIPKRLLHELDAIRR